MGGTVLNYKAKDIFREGETAKAKEMALTMHENGLTDDVIAKYARESVETIRQWLNPQPEQLKI